MPALAAGPPANTAATVASSPARATSMPTATDAALACTSRELKDGPKA